MIVYNIHTGKIIAEIPDTSDPYFVLREFNDVKNNEIGTLLTPSKIRRISNYRVINGELVKLSDQEIMEQRLYGKILSEEERELLKLQPTPEEIQKAEQTIEILTLIQEVL